LHASQVPPRGRLSSRPLEGYRRRMLKMGRALQRLTVLVSVLAGCAST